MNCEVCSGNLTSRNIMAKDCNKMEQFDAWDWKTKAALMLPLANMVEISATGKSGHAIV